jgi:hypothetical protein
MVDIESLHSRAAMMQQEALPLGLCYVVILYFFN